MERSILGVKLMDRIRNTTLRSKTQIVDVARKAAKLKWDWACHVCRIPSELAGYRELHGEKGVQLSCAQIKQFVNGHNVRRQRVARGAVPGQPTAANMIYMVWDEELAEKATRWAENGIFGHNPDRTVGSQRWNLVGENVFINNLPRPFDVAVIPDIDAALDDWFGEHQNYGFEPYSLVTPRPIGHYTQMVWAESTHVGCGISQKRKDGWTTTLFVCNYAPTGNFLGQVPYYSNGITGYLRCVNGTCRRSYGYYC